MINGQFWNSVTLLGFLSETARDYDNQGFSIERGRLLI